MRHYKDVQVTETKKEYLGFTCDKCGKQFLHENKDGTDWIEIQEKFSYSFTGGYGSVFGDMCSYRIDLCQRCLDETIGKYFKEVELEDRSF